MDLYYVDESYDAKAQNPNQMRFVLSAVRIREEDWESHMEALFAWRAKVKARLGVHMGAELHATELLGSRGPLAPVPIDKAARVALFAEALEVLAALPDVHIINVSLPGGKKGADINALETSAWERLFNRINRTGKQLERRALLVCDEGKEEKLTRLCRHLRRENRVPSRYTKWGDTGEKTKHMPLDYLVEDPLFKSSKSSYLLQLADLVAYALLRHDNPTQKAIVTGVSQVFPTLKPVLYTQACKFDSYGVVRR